MPLIRRQPIDWAEAVFIQISESCTAHAIRTKKWKYGVTVPLEKVRDSGSDYYVESELYDLVTDPYELCNLTGLKSHQPVEERLSGVLKSRIREVEMIEVVIEPSPPRSSEAALCSARGNATRPLVALFERNEFCGDSLEGESR